MFVYLSANRSHLNAVYYSGCTVIKSFSINMESLNHPISLTFEMCVIIHNEILWGLVQPPFFQVHILLEQKTMEQLLETIVLKKN